MNVRSSPVLALVAAPLLAVVTMTSALAGTLLISCSTSGPAGDGSGNAGTCDPTTTDCPCFCSCGCDNGCECDTPGAQPWSDYDLACAPPANPCASVGGQPASAGTCPPGFDEFLVPFNNCGEWMCCVLGAVKADDASMADASADDSSLDSQPGDGSDVHADADASVDASGDAILDPLSGG